MKELKQYLKRVTQINDLPLFCKRKTKLFAFKNPVNRKSLRILLDSDHSDCSKLHNDSRKTGKFVHESLMSLSNLFINAIQLR